MVHDVFICYDENDKKAGEEICHVLEENNIKCWIKSRDYSSRDSVEKISKAVKESKCLLLIYSKNSKDSPTVITEVDIAFSNNVSILTFNIDGSKNNAGLEFFLKNKPWISLFPNVSEQLRTLVKDTSQMISDPIEKPRISSKSVKYFKEIKPQGSKRLRNLIIIAVPVVIALILIFTFIISPTGQYTTGDGNFTMKITNVEVNNANGMYFFTVFGESYNMPENSNQYIMKIHFLDGNNNEVYSVNSSADEFSSGIICRIKLPENNVRNVTFELVDLEGNIISKDSYLI